jgi:hypothetical protein
MFGIKTKKRSLKDQQKQSIHAQIQVCEETIKKVEKSLAEGFHSPEIKARAMRQKQNAQKELIRLIQELNDL